MALRLMALRWAAQGPQPRAADRMPGGTRSSSMTRWWLVLVVVAAACSSTDAGPDAPRPESAETACSARACASIPGDWDVEVGDDFISFSHPTDPAQILGTVGSVDMQGVIAGAGGTWPASTEAVVEAFFELLDETQSAGLDEITTRPDGSVAGRGTLEDLRIWYRLIPVDGSTAVGVEVRAPNLSWQEHVDVLLDGVSVVPG